MTDGVDRPSAARRDRRGRFLRGASGNSAGRPPGGLNAATRTAAALVEADRAFIAAHPLPFDRMAHPLGVEMRDTWQRLSACLDRVASFNQGVQFT